MAARRATRKARPLRAETADAALRRLLAEQFAVVEKSELSPPVTVILPAFAVKAMPVPPETFAAASLVRVSAMSPEAAVTLTAPLLERTEKY